jgi:GTP-binding protein
MSTPLQLEFVCSAPDVTALPAPTTEVAVVGRSNVGKSSLINALANRNRLAQVSKTPGRTRLLNVFEAKNGGRVVDLPGYGYAAVPAKIRSGWPQMIERYLLEREGLQMVMVLVDGEIGPTNLDLQVLDWLRGHEVPHTVVATKHDKVRPSKLKHRKSELAAACMLEPGDVIWVSAAKGTNIDRLRGLVRTWLAP